MWLQDFLRIDLPNCRTITYGYDCDLDHDGIQAIKDYDISLLEELKKARKSQEVRTSSMLLSV